MDLNDAVVSPSVRSGLPITDALLRLLEGSIASGELQLGDRLAEQTLADKLGVSRGPIREAIRTLEGRGIVERTPNAGVRVRNLSIDDLEQLLVTREALEGMCCRLAAENMTLKEVQGLRACVGEDEQRLHDEGVGATFRPGAEDNDFHARIASGSRNLWIAQYLTRDVYALLRLYRLKQISLGNRATESRNEHLEIIEQIQRRNADGAEHLMRAHVRRGRERLLVALGK
jgi:DNA-binding GntR family transcriptional regulator